MSVTKINYAPKRIGTDDISTSSLQEFRDRTIKSRIWPSIQPYVDLSFCNLSTLLHMNQLFATLETCIFLVFQLKSNASSHFRTSGLKTIGHRYLFGDVLPSFSFASASFQVAEAVFDILFATQILLLLASVYLVIRVRREPIRKSDGSKSISWLLSQVLVIKNAAALGPITEVATLVIKYSNYPLIRALGVISLLLLPLETLVHCCLTYDYGFITTNKVQGRGYAFFFVRSIGLIFVTILRTAWEGHRTDASDLLINLISLALSLSLVYMQITQNIYYWSPSLEKVSTFALSLYSWESFTILLLTLWPDVISDFDLDYQTVIMMPLIFWAERNLLTSHRSKVGNLGSHLGHRTAADGVFYLELLYGAFRNFKDEENAFMVGSSLSRHTLACKDPLCLCFFLRSNVDINSGFDAGRSARELAHKSLFADKKNSAELKEGAVESSGFGKLCTIGLPDVISNYKSKHFKVASIEINNDRTAIKVTESEFKSDSDKMGFILTLQEPTSYLATILGFFRSLILDHAKGNNLDAVIGFLRFAIGEYGSCICALLVLYEYIYSSDYTRHSSTTADFLLINLMQQARRKLAEEDSENRPALEGKTLTQVLSLRKRVQTVVKRTMDGIVGKRDMYEELVNQRGEADTAYVIGQAQQINQSFLEGEFAELLAHRVPNIDLLKAAIHFQMFVLEKKSTPRSLLKRFKELTQDYLHRTTYDPVDGIPVLRHASPFASDHVVVLARYTNNSYRISHFTENAQELFCSESRELVGRKLSDFMPLEIAQSHDEIINGFLNGQSRTKFEIEIPAVMISDNGAAKSITVIPRVESIFTEEVYVAALIQNRNQLALSTTITSLSGRIQKLGRMTSQFDWTVQEGESVFKVLPGLFHALYPSSKASFSKRIRQAEEKVHEATTLRPPDFDKSAIDPSTRSNADIGESLLNNEIQRGSSYEPVQFVDEGAKEMLHLTGGTQVPEVQPGQTVTVLAEVFMYCFYDGIPSSAPIEDFRKTEKVYSVGGTQIGVRPAGHGLRGNAQLFSAIAEQDLEKICRIFQHDRLTFAKNIEYTQKVCLKIDTHHYQNDFFLREISILKSERAGPRHFMFFQTLSSKIPRMIGIFASISPETVEELNRFWLQSKKHRPKVLPAQLLSQELPGTGDATRRHKPVLNLRGQLSSTNPALPPTSVKIAIPPALKGASSKHPQQQIRVQPDTSERPETRASPFQQAPEGALIPASEEPSAYGESDDDASKVVHGDMSESPRDKLNSEPLDNQPEKKQTGPKLLLKTKTDGTVAKTDLTGPSQMGLTKMHTQANSREELHEEINRLSEVNIPREVIDYLAIMIEQFKNSDEKTMGKISLYMQELDMNADKAGSSLVERHEVRLDARMRAGNDHEVHEDEGNKTIKYSRDTEQRTEKQLEELRKLEEMDIQVTSNMISTVRSKSAHHHELQHIRKVMKLRLNSAASHLVIKLLYLIGVLAIVVWLVMIPVVQERHNIVQNNQVDTLVLIGGMGTPFAKIYKTTSAGLLTQSLVGANVLPADTIWLPETEERYIQASAKAIKDTITTYKEINKDLELKLRTSGFQYDQYTFFQRSMQQPETPPEFKFSLTEGFYSLGMQIVEKAYNIAEKSFSTSSFVLRLRRLSIAFYASYLADIRDFQDLGLNVTQVEIWIELGLCVSSFVLLLAASLAGSYVLRNRQQRLVEVMQHVDYGKCEDARVRLAKSLNYLQSARSENRELEENLERLEESIRRRHQLSDRDDPHSPDESRYHGDNEHEQNGAQTTNGPLMTEMQQGEISMMKGDHRLAAVEISIAPLESPKKDKPNKNRLGRDSSNRNLQGSWLSGAGKKRKPITKKPRDKKKRVRSGPSDLPLRNQRSGWAVLLGFFFVWVLAFVPILAGYLTYRSKRNNMEQKLYAASVLYTDAAHLQETIAWQYVSMQEHVLLISGKSTNSETRDQILSLQANDFEVFSSHLGRYINGDLSALAKDMRNKVICDSPSYSPEEQQTCKSVISNYRETLYDGIQQYLYATRLVFQNKTTGTLTAEESIFEATRVLDKSSDYFSQGFIEVARQSLREIQANMESEATLLSSLGYVFVLLVAVVLLVHRWYWIPRSTSKFRMIFSTLLVLNDDILMNPYLMQFLVASSNSLMLK